MSDDDEREDNLAALYEAQGRYADAEPLFKRVIAIFEKSLGPKHRNVALSLNNLATLYDDQGRHADAELLYKRALTISEKALGPDHPNLAASLNNLALLYTEDGRFTEAEPLYKRSLAQRANLISQAQSFADSYNELQLASSSAAAEAVEKLEERFAAGSGELAELVRKGQDLIFEADKLDKTLIAAVSKGPNERNEDAEQGLRKRLAEIGFETAKLSDVLAKQFPDYLALASL